MFLYTIIRGLKPGVRSHFLQAKPQSIPALIEAARIADVVVTSAEPTVSAAERTEDKQRTTTRETQRCVRVAE